MTTNRRLLSFALLILWVAAVAYLTLTPGGYGRPTTLRAFLCFACGTTDGSDIIRNWILFVPGGLLAAHLLGPGRAIALTICYTGFIEVAQLWLPGRDSALQDLVFNGMGGVTGASVMYRGLSSWSRRTLMAAAAAAWLAPIALLVPKTTPFDLYGQWTPRFGRTARYQGRIADASMGSLRIESRRIPGKDALDEAITERKPIRLLLEAGPIPSSFAPIFQIADARQQFLLELGALGPDLILRGRNPARILKLDQPDTRWSGAMLGVAVGDTVSIIVDRGRNSICMSVGERERCNLAPSLADGWGHILYLEGPPAWFRALMSIAWALGLGGILGLTAGTWRSALGIGVALALVGYVGATLSPDVRPSVFHAAVLVVGVLAGAAMRSPVAQLWRTSRTDLPTSGRPSSSRAPSSGRSS
jgi:hypothetical protein